MMHRTENALKARAVCQGQRDTRQRRCYLNSRAAHWVVTRLTKAMARNDFNLPTDIGKHEGHGLVDRTHEDF